jgi:hypothetical protein
VDFLSGESVPPYESNRRLKNYSGGQAYDRSTVTHCSRSMLRHVLYEAWTDGGHAHSVGVSRLIWGGFFLSCCKT